jgi:hypothetical protein
MRTFSAHPLRHMHAVRHRTRYYRRTANDNSAVARQAVIKPFCKRLAVNAKRLYLWTRLDRVVCRTSCTGRT